jgi:hypothetical protein
MTNEEIAQQLERMTEHADRCLNDDLDRQYILEDLQARVENLASVLRGQEPTPWAYNYPMHQA